MPARILLQPLKLTAIRINGKVRHDDGEATDLRVRNAQESAVTTDEVSSPWVPASIRPLSRLAAGAGNQISGAPSSERP